MSSWWRKLQTASASDRWFAGALLVLSVLELGVRWGKSAPGWVLEWLDSGWLAVLLAWGLRTWVFQAYFIPSGSMEPTLQVNDRLWVNKFRYGLRVPFTGGRVWGGRAPQRGEVVVFRDPRGTGQDLVKRCVAVAGDTLELRGACLVLNGRTQAEPYLGAVTGGDDTRATFGPVTVPGGHYFMLGDHRKVSLDSRQWGPLPARCLQGRAGFIYWPLQRCQVVR